jgi:hypothetical protein
MTMDATHLGVVGRPNAATAAIVAACGLMLLAVQLPAQTAKERSDTSTGCIGCGRPKRFMGAANELVVFEMMPYSYNRWIGKKAEDQTTLASWSYNLRRGWGWDNDHFPVNQFAHPYSGALFYNSARSHGYDLWSSAPFALGGSVLWEYFGERSRPSLNDLVNTTLGGITLGETMHRFSSMILDHRATGPGRVVREIGAALVDPPRALTRMVNGDVGRVGANAADRLPGTVQSHLEVGVQRLYRDVSRASVRGTRHTFANYALAYGDPLAGDAKQPFGAFRLEAAFAGGVAAGISEMRALGFLAVHDVVKSERRSQQFALAMHYHYNSNRAFVTGGQGFSGGLISRYPLGQRTSIRTEVWLSGIVLGAVKPDFVADSAALARGAERGYDYGPGGGVRMLARLDRGGCGLIDASYQPFWYGVASGVARTHFYDITSVRAQLPLYHGTAVGIRQVLYRRVASYATHPTTRMSDGQSQAFLALNF